ncbi:MAG: hypothetical protein J6B89_03135 [Bacilli bacterium]|nr:hypothetical protein [Bacilli bacterium]
MIPLKNTKSIFVVKPENMVVQIGEFIFISNDNISDVKIKRLGLISAVDKTVDIKLKDGADFNLIVRNKEKLISYHEENFLKFVNKYKK